MAESTSLAEAAIVMTRVAALGGEYPDELGHSEALTELWDSITSEIEVIKSSGQMVDVPFDQSLMPEPEPEDEPLPGIEHTDPLDRP